MEAVRVINTFTRITPYCRGAFGSFPFLRMPPAWHMTYTVNIISKGGENPGTGSLERLHFELQCLAFLHMLCFDVGELGPFSPVLA